MAYLANRVALLILTLFLVSVIAFSITNLLPGNVAKMMLGLKGTPEMLANLENALGLNDPLPQQYWRWFSGMLQGDMGNSIRFKEPITKLLGQKLAVSSILMVMSLFIAFVLAIPLGIISAVKHNRWPDTLCSSVALAGISLPDFFWGIIFMLLFARTLGWLPSSGYVSPADDLWLALKHATLPALTLGLGLMAHLTRMMRSAMLEVLRADYIRTARAKGVRSTSVILRHALRNALSPVITVLGLQLGYIFGGIIVIEMVFNYSGMGFLTYQAMLNRDIPLIQASIFVIAAVFMVTNLIVDLSYRLLDPRVQLE